MINKAYRVSVYPRAANKKEVSRAFRNPYSIVAGSEEEAKQLAYKQYSSEAPGQAIDMDDCFFHCRTD